MSHQSTLSKLFFLLTAVDGEIKQKEEAVARIMCEYESIDYTSFMSSVQQMKTESTEELYLDAVQKLKQAAQPEQIRHLGWLCLVANADGFMEQGEWRLIYKLYHKDLGLPLPEVLREQKRLMQVTRMNQSTLTV